jgi:hypothetical protein
MAVDELRRFLADLPDDMQVLFHDAEEDTFDTPHLALMPIITDEDAGGPLYQVDERGERTLVILQEPLGDEAEEDEESKPEEGE